MSLQIDFNNAVLYLEQKEYIKSIKLFKKTAKILKIPSFLNIGIAYYKLNSINNAYLYLKKIYDINEAAKEDIFSYISASYYLYLITDDRKYITTILTVVKNVKKEKITEHVRRLVVDTYIILKQYKNAIKTIKNMKNQDKTKLALLYIKVKNYTLAEVNIEKAFNETRNEKEIDELLWFQVFINLKSNNIIKLKDNISLIKERKKRFISNQKMPLKIYFNPDKYTAEEYFKRVVSFTQNRKIDMIFYFAPFIFIDKKEIYNDSTYGYVLKSKQNIDSLDMMVKYNQDFLSIVKNDPIIRTNKLQKMINNKYDTKSYEYYNLALSYAQIFDFRNAHKYFKKAYSLNHSNKLYSSMTLISALRANLKINKIELKKIEENLISYSGTYKYMGKYIHKLIYNPKTKLNKKKLNRTAKKSIFLRSLYFIEHINKNGIQEDEPLLETDVKDPLVFLLRSIAKKKDENKFEYISRLQNNIPKTYNDYFLKGPIVITQYYIDLLKGLGIFDIVDFHIKGDKSPTYLRTKALIQLYDGYPIQSIKILENLQETYNLNDKYTSYLLISAFLRANDYSNASATLGMLQFEQNDSDAKFLNGVQLLQSLKLNTANNSFRNKYKGFLIDFELEGFDEYLESL
ncbi:MAG TPA: hypothetical protein EYG97_03055 [Arcobacter sp.]|nr:hypothetical protein [Arcobacter sp.]HIP55979.1 hypothetical protein [Arcobacter sp.]